MERFEHGGDIYGNPGVSYDFSVNVNPLGMPDEVYRALELRAHEFTRYPDPQCRELCAAISGCEAVPRELILCGNGAADLIYRLCYAIKPRGALLCSPTFSEYERALEQVGCQVKYHTLTAEDNFALTDNIIKQIAPGTDILFLCTPNNPTGRLIQHDLMERILCAAAENRTTVVVDECFLAFARGRSAKEYLRDMPNLVVLKAFTKIYAMAGLRLGYLMTSDRGLLDKLSDAAQCWSVSVPAQIAGVAALSCANWQERTLRLIERERPFLSEALRSLNVTVFQSDANYLLLSLKRPLYEPLLQRGILVRRCENFKGLDGTYYRVCIKTREENIFLINQIREVIGD